MTHPAEQWRLLRTKADETTDDPDWVATNDPEAGSIDFVTEDAEIPPGPSSDGRPFTGVEVVCVGVTSGRAVQDPATMTLDLQLVEYFTRPVGVGGAEGLEPVLFQTPVVEDVPLNRKTYWPMNGGQFTIRITGDANDAVDNIEVWYRAISR